MHVCLHKAILCNYIVIPNYEILAAVRTHTHTHIVLPLSGNDVIAEDEILALFTLEMILTVERNIHQ